MLQLALQHLSVLNKTFIVSKKGAFYGAAMQTYNSNYYTVEVHYVSINKSENWYFQKLKK